MVVYLQLQIPMSGIGTKINITDRYFNNGIDYRPSVPSGIETISNTDCIPKIVREKEIYI